jgi:nitroimidazol reductase NimA-like FMN-containing flavoprotein (pyridoxamine 5'-phosphate oxidase superfamily)
MTDSQKESAANEAGRLSSSGREQSSVSSNARGDDPDVVRELSAEECAEVLSRAYIGRLACSRDDQPYVVPIHFAPDKNHVYSFAMPGQKLEWMRSNPRLCLEIDDVTDSDHWTSLVAFGRYEELPDTPDNQADRARAYRLLQKRPMWWHPGAFVVTEKDGAPALTLYRINIFSMTGRREAPMPPSAP